MAKQLLIETKTNNSLKLQEGIKGKTNNCLGTLKGPCADFINPTRNDNLYGRKLWENVFNDDLVKEALEDKVLIGELDHPGDRLETKAVNSAIVMTDYEFDDDNGVVIGTFDILDTPSGKILKSLVDYGCRIGVSSRGEGDVTTNAEGINVVDEDTYYFVAFDAVVLPAVKAAKPAIQESYTRRRKTKSLVEQFKSQINHATTQSELNMIKKVIKSSGLSNVVSLKEAIDNRSSALEGTDCSSTLLEDLEQSMTQITNLKGTVSRLKEEVTNCKSELRKSKDTNAKLNEELQSTKNKFQNLTQKYTKNAFELDSISKKATMLESKVTKISKANRQLKEDLRIDGSQTDSYETEISKLQEDLSKSKTSISRVKKSLSESQRALSEKDNIISSKNSIISNKDKQIKALNEQVKILKSKSEQHSRTSHQLEDKLSKQEQMLKSETTRQVESIKHQANERLTEANRQISALENKEKKATKEVKALQETLGKSQKSVSDKNRQIESLQEQIRTLKSNSNNELEDLKNQSEQELLSLQEQQDQEINDLQSQLDEALNRIDNEQEKFNEQYDDISNQLHSANRQVEQLMSAYVKCKANSIGVDSKRLMGSVTPDMTIADIDKVINEEVSRLDRYKKLPIADDGLVDSINGFNSHIKMNGVSPANDEDLQTLSFLEQLL